jgi:hypothetical protein
LAEPQKDAAAIRRARQTLINLMLALGVSVGLLLTFMMIVPRDDTNLIKPVDYTSIAADVRSSTGIDVLAPDSIPDGWWANNARWRDTTADGVNYWFIGFVGPTNQFVGITQAFGTNPTWLALKTVEYEIVSESNPSDGSTLTEYRGRAENKSGEKLWIYTNTENNDAVIVDGTASREEFEQFFNLVNLPFN